MLLTTLRLINLKGTNIQRSIKLTQIQALTKSTEKGNFNFLVHVEDAYDYGFICKEREALVEAIKSSYHNLLKRNLLIYGVKGKIERYVTPKKGKFDVRKAKGILPPDEYILYDEDVYNRPGKPVEEELSID